MYSGLIPNKAGLDYERYTLSTRGYPCHYDKSDTSCAWCVPGAQQCGKAKTWANKVLDRNRRMKPKWKWENTCLPVLNSDRKSYAKSPRIICIGKREFHFNNYNELFISLIETLITKTCKTMLF